MASQAREDGEIHKPLGLEENKKIAQTGGNVAKVAKDSLEKELGKSVVSNSNNLKYKYASTNKKIKN